MAVAFDTSGGGTTGSTSSTTYTWTHSTAAGVSVIAAVAVDASTDSMTLGVTLDGTSMTSAKKIHCNNSTSGYLQVFTATGIGSGSHTLVATASSAPAHLCGGSLSFTGGSGTFNVWPTSPSNGNGYGSGTAPSAATSGATTSGGIVAAFAASGSGGLTAASGATSRWMDNYAFTAAAGDCGAETIASTGGTQTLSFTCTTDWYACILIEVLPPGPHAGTATLTGIGTLTGAGTFTGAATLAGAGTLTATGTHTSGSRGVGTAALSGRGTLSGAVTGTFLQAAALSGIGSLAATWTGTVAAQPFTLSGSGTLGVSGVALGFPAALAGQGTLSVLQATGGLVFASPGADTPQAYPLSSQVMVAAPGSVNWQPLASLGAVTALSWSFTCPGGPDKMTCTVMVPATYRSQLFSPGWQVKILRGGHIVWTGRLDEPTPSPAGWTLTAVGDGARGQDFLAIYSSTWPNSQPDESINGAITRGLPWVSAGIGTPAGAWYGQAVDSGAQTVAALLNLICTRGGLTWMASSQPGGLPGTDITVFPLPTVPNRLLTCTTPVARTLGGDINTIWIRYQATSDTSSSGGQAATFATTSVQNAASVAAHGVIETFIDLSDVGHQSAAAAQAVGNKVLGIYQRASFAGPFTGHYGQLMNAGGVPIDPGCEQAGTMCRLILTDVAYGAELVPGPISFVVGEYTWDDLAQTFTIVPLQTLNTSLSGLLSMQNTVLRPITVAGA